MSVIAWLLLLCSCAYAFETVAFTGFSCPLPWRLQDPGLYCVTHEGVPQKGCVWPPGWWAYEVRVEPTVFDNCFKVRWFWKI